MKIKTSNGIHAILSNIKEFEEKSIPDHIDKENIIQVAFLDTETTGLDYYTCELIEIFIRVVNVNKETGEIYNTVKTYHSYNDPEFPIPEDMTRINGITNKMVEGIKVDWTHVIVLLEQSNFVVSHNVAFDRGFVEKYIPETMTQVWVCSKDFIDWRKQEEMKTSSQENILVQLGYFYDAHSAKTDTDALIMMMRNQSFSNPEKTYMKMMLDFLLEDKYYLVVSGTKFNEKDLLKSLNMRWDGQKWEGVFDLGTLHKNRDKLVEYCKLNLSNIVFDSKKIKRSEWFPSKRIGGK
jgi:DNA polymerase-3 subunit epsilon